MVPARDTTYQAASRELLSSIHILARMPPAEEGTSHTKPETDSDGFTKVTSKSQNRRRKPARSTGDHSASDASDESRPEITVRQLHIAWNKAKAGWAEDACRPKIKELLENSCGVKLCSKVATFLMIGLGSLTGDKYFSEQRLWQLAIGLSIVEACAYWRLPQEASCGISYGYGI